MKIEFKNLNDRFEVIEHVLRKATLEYMDEDSEPVMHLQARLLIKRFDGDCANCSISYYSAEGDFLGLDDADSLYLKKSPDNSVPVSVPLDIPDGAERAVVRFIFNDDADSIGSFYSYALKGFTVLGFIWLATLIFKGFN